MAVSSPNFYDLLRPGLKHKHEQISQFLFEDPDSPTEQSGKFKIEGCWEHGLFRSSKAYFLENKTEDTIDTVARMRSIPRKHQSALSLRHFGQDPHENVAVVRSTEMRPTQGLDIVMLKQGRSLSHALNFKRKMIVRRTRQIELDALKNRSVKNKTKTFFQDPCHSVALD
jgi:hypothetical protein